MNINTSNTYKYKSGESQNSILSSRRQVLNSSNFREINQQSQENSRVLGFEDNLSSNQAIRTVSFPGQINFEELLTRKEVLQQLLSQFRDKDGRVIFEPYKRDEYSKRLLLLQQQIDGLMRQTYMFNSKDKEGKVRTLDYTTLLIQKQNQVNQLQKKIGYLETQLRMKDQRQKDLEDQLQKRFSLIKSKNDEIERLKNSPRSFSDLGKSQAEGINTYIKNICSRLEQLSRRAGTLSQLQNQVQGWIMSLPQDSELKRKLRSADEKWLQDKYKKYVSYLTTEAGSVLNTMTRLYTTQIDSLKSKGATIEYDPRIIEITKQIIPKNLLPTQEVLMSNQVMNSRVGSNIGSITNLINLGFGYDQPGYLNGPRKVVQVPVQDSRTKALIYRLATQMRRLYTKYPALAKQISPQLTQFFSQQIIDTIEVDELDRLVQIVKYKPDIIKVQNVYAYSSDKNRKVQFHLRVLIKALLQQMERIRIKTGIQPQIDEGVIGMIRQQIIDVVDVDDILKVYRTVPKIVEVQKVVEQVVQKIVPVPHFVTVQTQKTDVIPINKIQVVKDTVNVPLQVPKYETLVHQKLLVAPQYRQKVVVSTALEQNQFETVTQIPTIRQVQKVIGLLQDNVKVVQVPGPQKIIKAQYQTVKMLIQQKIIPVQRIIQQIVQVPKIVEKIVTIIQQVPKIVQVQKIVQKIVPVTKYIQNQRIQNFVVQKPVEVICYVQKIVIIEKIVQRVITIPEIIQKIVQVITRQEVIKEVEIIKEVPIYKTDLKIVDQIREVPIKGAKVEVAKPVDRIVQVPIIHEKVRVQTEYRKQPIIQREQRLIREPVHVEVPVVLFEQRIVEVVKPEVHIVKQQYPRQLIVQKVVPIQTVRQQIIQAPCIVEKIIQKIVEVPRVVQVEKIVEKIVLIPRIIQKIVQVQKIVQKIVERIIQKRDIQQIQLIRQVPIEVEKVHTVEVPSYIIQKVEVPHFIEKDRIIINQTTKQSVRVQIVEQPPRVAIERREVPIQILVQKLVPLRVQDHIYVQLKEQIVVPIEVPVPTTLVQQKIVPVEHVIPIVQQVERLRDKIVEVKVEMPGRVQTRDRIVQKLFVQKDINVVTNQIPYYNDRIVEVERVTQKIIPVEKIIKQVMQVPYMVQKIVNQVIQIPIVHQVERLVQVPIKTQQIVTVDRIVPKIVTLNKAFAQIVDKLHQFPRLVEQMKKVNTHIEKIVPEKHSATQVQSVEIYIQKAVIEQKMKQVDRFVNVINQQLQVAQRIIQKPSDPIIITQQKILEVPVIMQKIAQRIVIMPQVVQVLKYVHQMTDNNSLGLALTGQIATEEAEYQRLGKRVNGQLGKLRDLLIQLKKNPLYKDQITIIDNFLAEFNKFILYPRIREVMTEKVVQSVVEKDKIVRVPVKSSDDERKGLASAVLIDKLLMQLKRLKQANPNTQMRLDPDIALIFGDQLEPISSKYGNNYNQILDQYSKSIFSRFNQYGTWTSEHQRMLKQFIDQRFELATRLNKSNKQSIKYKQLYSSLVQKSSRDQIINETLKSKFKDLQSTVKKMIVAIVDIGMKRALQDKLNNLAQAILGFASGSDTITYQLKEMSQMDKQRANRYLRQKDALIVQMRGTIQKLKKQLEERSRTEVQGQLVFGNCNIHNQIIGDMQNELNQLRRYRQLYANIPNTSTSTITKLLTHQVKNNSGSNDADLRKFQAQNERLKSQITRSRDQVARLQSQIKRLRDIQVQHRGCNNKIRELQQRYKIVAAQSQRYQKELIQIRSSSVKDGGRRTAIGSMTSPQRQSMSESYGTNYGRYIEDNNSQIRNQRITQRVSYEKNVFRSGGNYGPIGSGDLSVGYGKAAQSIKSGNGGIAYSSSNGLANSGVSNNGSGQLMGGGMINTGLSANTNSGNYSQQKSANYLSESQASKVSGVSGVSRGELSNRSSKAGGNSYQYNQMIQRQNSVKGSIPESSDFSGQKFLKLDQSGSSQLFGTPSREVIQRTINRQNLE